MTEISNSDAFGDPAVRVSETLFDYEAPYNLDHPMMRRHRPEVLAPAGNLQTVKVAIDYGADAVYCAGKMFGMRTAPKNLSHED